jgi:hypothetical protein
MSCDSEKGKLIIAGFSEKYWDVYRLYNKDYKMTDYGYCFKRDGTCIYYFYTRSKTKNLERNKFDFGDVIYPDTWSFKKDSTFNVMGIDYNVLRLSENEIIILNVLNKRDTVRLRLSKIDIKNSPW